jgi:DNA helicase MCM9
MKFMKRSEHVGRFVAISGTIIRTGMIKMLPTTKKFLCQKCKNTFAMHYSREQYNHIPKPTQCLGSTVRCDSTKFQEEVNPEGIIHD